MGKIADQILELQDQLVALDASDEDPLETEDERARLQSLLDDLDLGADIEEIVFEEPPGPPDPPEPLLTPAPTSENPVLTAEEMAEKYTVKELKELAKERGLSGYSRLKEAELIELLLS